MDYAGVHNNYKETMDLLLIDKESKQVRLTYKRTSQEGIVEIYHNGVWGAICADSWDKVDGLVICKMLGYRWVQAAWGTDARARTKLWLTELRCSGNEVSIWDCKHSTPDADPCSRDWQAHVSCSGSS